MIIAIGKSPNGGKGSISRICERFKLKRDAYYKYYRRYKATLAVAEKVISFAKEERKEQQIVR
jgi:hypothetical protein